MNGATVALDPPAARTPGRWRVAVATGVLAPLLIGFLASGLANRTVFAGWALAGAAGHVLLLSRGWGSWRPGWLTAAPLAWGALEAAGFAVLASRHFEVLDLGARAFLPAYHPVLTAPASWGAASLSLGVAAIAVALGSRRSP